MAIMVGFATLFGIILLAKIIFNLKARNKGNTYENCSVNTQFNDNEIPLSKALKNFKH